MVTDEEEREIVQADFELRDFVKTFAQKYPKLFKDGRCSVKIHPTVQHPFFAYTVSLDILEHK